MKKWPQRLRKAIGLIAVMLPASPCIGDESIDTLDDLQWRFRILLLDEEAAPQSELEAALKNAQAKIEERHLIWILISDQGVRSNRAFQYGPELIARIKTDYLDSSDSNAVLIGKDGGVKSDRKTLQLEEIFALIDSMPMRRAEMRAAEKAEAKK